MVIALIRIFIVLQREVRMFYKQLNKICGCFLKASVYYTTLVALLCKCGFKEGEFRDKIEEVVVADDYRKVINSFK